MGTIISVKGVSKHFGDVEALQDLSFTVEEGEIFGFLGPSGAGKTTTIKLLTRQLKQDAGEIQVFFHPIGQLAREDDDRIGVLSDNSGVYDRLTVWDNLNLFASLRKVGKQNIQQALEDVGLADAKNRAAKTLSRGMKQRLMLAQAILHKPILLFLDEPTASLDPGTSNDIHKLLKRLNNEGTTIFLTTHDMEEADKLCSRLAFLNKGEIVESGAPAMLKLKYAHNSIKAELQGGETLEVDKTPEGLMQLAESIKGKTIERIHSQEPTLEDVFLKVTGRALA